MSRTQQSIDHVLGDFKNGFVRGELFIVPGMIVRSCRDPKSLFGLTHLRRMQAAQKAGKLLLINYEGGGGSYGDH